MTNQNQSPREAPVEVTAWVNDFAQPHLSAMYARLKSEIDDLQELLTDIGAFAADMDTAAAVAPSDIARAARLAALEEVMVHLDCLQNDRDEPSGRSHSYDEGWNDACDEMRADIRALKEK